MEREFFVLRVVDVDTRPTTKQRERMQSPAIAEGDDCRIKIKRIRCPQEYSCKNLSPIGPQMHQLIKASPPTCSPHLLANGELFFFFFLCPYRQGSGTLSVAVGFAAAPLIGPLWASHMSSGSDWD
jgi:hypothetical protein